MYNYTIVLSKKDQKQLDKFTDDIAKPMVADFGKVVGDFGKVVVKD